MEAKATYHLPPNFSTPPPPDGPFHLGTVLREFEQKEQMRPLNKKISQRVEIPEKHEDAKAGFTATRKMMKAGECGVWAKFMGLNGVGGEASIGAERHDSDRYATLMHYTSLKYDQRLSSFLVPKVIRVFTVTHSKASRLISFTPTTSISQTVSSYQV